METNDLSKSKRLRNRSKIFAKERASREKKRKSAAAIFSHLINVFLRERCDISQLLEADNFALPPTMKERKKDVV